jgi:nucleoside-diphosphate-sugar epimerase
VPRIGISGGPVTNWVHAEDVARACIHCIDCPDTDDKIFNIADDEPTPFGDTATDYMEAYGLYVLGRIPLPPIQFLRLMKPLIDRQTTFNLINKPLAYVWEQVQQLYSIDSKLSVKVDREVSPYIFHNTIFDTAAIKNTGFQLKWPSHKKAIPSVLKWYTKNNWIPNGMYPY